MNQGTETKAYWGDKFIEILDPHKPGHIVRVYPDYWDGSAPDRWVGLTKTQVKLLFEGVQEEAVKTGESINWVFYTYINEALKEKNT